jgi:omega-amidase
MQDLVITLIQSRLSWEDRSANLDHLGKKIAALAEQTDLIILPEMFTTGFSMAPENIYEEEGGPAIDWMRNQAVLKNAVVCGSMIFKEKGSFYNRLVWMRPDGTHSTYDKRHLFRMADEHMHYTQGSKRLIEELKGWKIFPLICYDLRFPVWSRRITGNDYDCLIYIANWPERRNLHWKVLLQARAIENQSYCIGVNRVGEDGNGISHSGDSSVFGPRGELIYSKEHEENVAVVTLSKQELIAYRKAFPADRDADGFTID